MAYNTLKGVVEGSVDQHADQEIDGVKVFKNTVSASIFWDTDAQSPCATLKDLPITDIKGKAENGILVYNTDGIARTAHNFKYVDGTLHVKDVAAVNVFGDGSKLNSVPSDKFTTPIDAEFVNYGYGLQDLRGLLTIKVVDGLLIDEDGLSINLATNCGLSIKDKKLVLDPTKTNSINKDGQNLSDNDMLLVSDVSHGTTNNTTLANLYNNYIKLRVPHAAGTKNELQFKGKSDFNASSKLTFEPETSTLDIDGKLKTNNAVVKNKLQCEGAVYHNITTVSDKEYAVTPSDYTLLCNASSNKIHIILPPATTNTGRVIIIKKANSDKYKITSNEVSISCEEGRIDISDRIVVKMNYSSRTLQSDGENWWIIGTKGT